jgi:hypothetical protein
MKVYFYEDGILRCMQVITDDHEEAINIVAAHFDPDGSCLAVIK